MKLLPLLLFLTSLFSSINLHSQESTEDNYDFLVQKVSGDLNYDKIDDEVILKMDTKKQKAPLGLQIFLSGPNKKIELAVSSVKIFENPFPHNKNEKQYGNPVPDFSIENGNLIMLTDFDNRKSLYEFRFIQDQFKLLKTSRVKWD